jgi:uncharacterized protein (TIGR02996 family)
MTPDKALLDDIIAHPEDDQLRLVYADWLEERGQQKRAEFIQVQIELSRLTQDHERYADLRAREEALLIECEEEWIAPLLQWADRPGWAFRRGFLDGIALEAEAFLLGAEALLGTNPIRRVRLYGVAEHVGDLATCPLLTRLTALDLRGNGLDLAAVRELASSPFVANLAVLDLGNDNPECPNWLGDEGVGALISSAAFRGLEELDLFACGVGDEGAKLLAAPPHLPRLSVIRLASNEVGDEGFRAFLSPAALGRIRSLRLYGNRITDGSLAALAGLSARGRLTEVDLGTNRITDQGARSLLTSSGLSQGFRLILTGNRLSDEVRRLVRERFGDAVVV